MIIAISAKIGAGKDALGEIIQKVAQKSDDTHIGLPTWEIKKFADKLKDMVCMLIGCTREQLEDRNFKEQELGEEWDKYGIRFIYPNDEKSKDIYGGFATEKEAIDFEKKERIALQWDKSLRTEIVKSKMTPRLLLQLLGTECGRNIIHPQVWVNSLFSDYKIKSTSELAYNIVHEKSLSSAFKKSMPNWIITDCRFSNEAEGVKTREGINIRLNRPISQRFPEEWDNYVWLNGQNPTEKGFMRFLEGNDLDLYKKLTHASETSLDEYENFDYVIENDGTLEDLQEKVKEILIKENLI
ncbi:MAG: hypothetical protein KDH96_05565 [Candidatus Riesia sp.]|nr:hypothetical protein [Candidatus Riesia sp.]